MSKRAESDSMGSIEVEASKYWGAQTQRSYENFKIGRAYHDFMPHEIIHAYAILKKSAAQANHELNLLPSEKAQVISQVCDEIIEGKLNDHFPLVIWQTGSGTQTHMNVNEVISNRAIELLGGKMGSKDPIHPNDDVNKSQSSNDTFPTAMRIAAHQKITHTLLPALESFLDELESKSKAYDRIIKTGRTHLMDAAPLTLGQEFSGYAEQIKQGIASLKYTLKHLSHLPLGGTAVGTGLNTHPEFAQKAIQKIAQFTSIQFAPASNKFEGIASEDVSVEVSSALKRIALSLIKIANDIRWMGSGPRCGLSELVLPSNEPGSSIMPGKVNPTQCEALVMLATQVIGHDLTISFANSQSAFELNAARPVITYNLLHSMTLLAEGIENFQKKCLCDLQVNEKQLEGYVERSLMLATALNTSIGYDKASKIVKKAHLENLSLKEAAQKLNLLSAEEFDRLVDPAHMLGPKKS